MQVTRSRPPVGLAMLLIAGVAARVFLMLAYRPAALSNPDSARFLYYGHDAERFFHDSFGPVGYEAFLRALRLVTTRLEATIALQHLLGTVAALFVYAALRRADAPRWAALVPAGVLLLSGDQLYIEHALLSEPPFIALVAAGLYAAVRAITAPRAQRPAWLAVAGATLAASATFRNVGLVLVPALVVWALFALPAPWRGRLIGAAAGAGAALLVMLLYLGAAHAAKGHTGWTSVSGWSIYGRAAPFADCRKFTPPRGTRRLCQRTPPARRPGSLFYQWYRGSPARALFGGPPSNDALLGTFGKRAILAQPGAYVDQVTAELPRFVDVDAYPRRFSGGGPFLISRRDEGTERAVLADVRHDYSAAPLQVDEGVKRIAEWQTTQRLGGLVPGAFVVLMILGPLLARGPARRAALLFGLAGTVLVLMPAMTLTLIVRYTIPAMPFVAAAAGLGAAATLDAVRGWVRAGRRARAPS
ncbi:MAG: phospholipid carrier-dependent glycosyltransferase [Actinobacteria bacterium]|nr:phospholipid carrier-dependent glycosyltransferase [Actinomycetota bacterium]